MDVESAELAECGIKVKSNEPKYNIHFEEMDFKIVSKDIDPLTIKDKDI